MERAAASSDPSRITAFLAATYGETLHISKMLPLAAGASPYSAALILKLDCPGEGEGGYEVVDDVIALLPDRDWALPRVILLRPGEAERVQKVVCGAITLWERP